MKPLGHKAYGSIPHVSQSKLGPGDYHINEGQERICFTGQDSKGRSHRVIITEKLDGSNVAVAKKDGEVLALIRAGHLAQQAMYQHQVFDQWVHRRNWNSLPEGYRVCGEWLFQAHGTLYEVESPFIVFDAFDETNTRLPVDDAYYLYERLGLLQAHVISDDKGGMSVERAINALGTYGFHGAKEQAEGVVWRVETNGKFNFMAKFVHSSKIAGKYFNSGPNGEDVFNLTVEEVLN